MTAVGASNAVCGGGWVAPLVYVRVNERRALEVVMQNVTEPVAPTDLCFVKDEGGAGLACVPQRLQSLFRRARDTHTSCVCAGRGGEVRGAKPTHFGRVARALVVSYSYLPVDRPAVTASRTDV